MRTSPLFRALLSFRLLTVFAMSLLPENRGGVDKISRYVSRSDVEEAIGGLAVDISPGQIFRKKVSMPILLTYRPILSTPPRFSIRRLMAKKVSNLKLNRARRRGLVLIALSLGLFASSKLIDECFQVPYQALTLLIIASFACGMWGLWCLIVEGKSPSPKG